MKIIIEIPEKTNAHIRSDYGHGVRGLRIEDMEMLVDAVYHGEPYHNRPRGEWIDKKDSLQTFCSHCDRAIPYSDEYDFSDFILCPYCGSDNRPRKGGET